jgi:predicted PurR-regulated permease PerM
LRFIGILLVVFLLWSIRNVVGILLFSVIIASVLMPAVNWLQRKRVPRGLAIALLYLVVVGVLTLAVILFGRIVSDQVSDLAQNIPSYYNRAVDTLFGQRAGDQAFAEALQKILQSLNQFLLRVSTQVATGTIALFGGLFSFIGILVLTFYMLLERDAFKKFMNAIAPAHYLPYLHQLVDRIQDRLSGWARGQFFLSLIIGAASYIGLLVLGVDYALSLALIAGLTEVVPVAGPILGAVPAVLVAFGQSPALGLAVAILYLVIQQLENNFIVPKVMSKTTGLNPIVILVVVLIGAKLAGFVGVILAIPLTLVVDVFVQDFFQESDEANDVPADL